MPNLRHPRIYDLIAKIRATFSIEPPPTYAVMIKPLQLAIVLVGESVLPSPSTFFKTITFQNKPPARLASVIRSLVQPN